MGLPAFYLHCFVTKAAESGQEKRLTHKARKLFDARYSSSRPAAEQKYESRGFPGKKYVQVVNYGCLRHLMVVLLRKTFF